MGVGGGGVCNVLTTICTISPQAKTVLFVIFWCIFCPHRFLCVEL